MLDHLLALLLLALLLLLLLQLLALELVLVLQQLLLLLLRGLCGLRGRRGYGHDRLYKGCQCRLPLGGLNRRQVHEAEARNRARAGPARRNVPRWHLRGRGGLEIRRRG